MASKPSCLVLSIIRIAAYNNQEMQSDRRPPARIFHKYTPSGAVIVKKTPVRTHAQVIACLKQATLLRLSQHPSVVRYCSQYAESKEFFCLETEWLPGGTLEGRVVGGDWERLWLWVYQLSCGLEHLHRRGIIHRDVKPENVGVDSQGNAKLIDFGSAILKWELQQEGFPVVGTPAYTAPEMIARHKYDEKVDIYALGVCIFELVYRRRLFPAESVSEYWRQAVKSEVVLGEECPQDLAALMRKMLAKDPANRITATAVLNEHAIRRRFPLK